jgi:transposase-like protein
MYSYEDRVQAVRLYLNLEKRIKATIRQLGYALHVSQVQEAQPKAPVG